LLLQKVKFCLFHLSLVAYSTIHYARAGVRNEPFLQFVSTERTG